MIPEGSKTEIYRKRGKVIFLNLDILDMQQKPCKNYANYAAYRSPICGCRPCVEKFIHVQRCKGIEFSFCNITMRELFAKGNE